MEFRMSSVCVVLRSLAAAAFFLLPFCAPPVVLTRVGVLYFTRDTLLSIFIFFVVGGLLRGNVTGSTEESVL